MTDHEKYREPLELYRTTDLSIREICSRCGVPVRNFSAYVRTWHRDLMFRRHGREGDSSGKLHSGKGQTPEAREKYREAVEACDSMEYIEWNVSQIARKYGVNPTGLSNFMRRHYPDILPRREAERKRRGVADNLPRGVKVSSREAYADAVRLLQTSDMTFAAAAEKCGVSPSGLEAHIHFYHPQLKTEREKRREKGKESSEIGALMGNGLVRAPRQDKTDEFAEAVELFRSTGMTYAEIAEKTGVSETGLIWHIRKWHRPLLFARYIEATSSSKGATADGSARLYRVAAAQKYAEAIEMLRTSGMHTAQVAKKFGFNPEVFRNYVKEHEPELAERFGRTIMPNGRTVLKRTYEKYLPAIEEFVGSTLEMKAVAERHGLVYVTFANFLRRNLPEEVEKWKQRKNLP